MNERCSLSYTGNYNSKQSKWRTLVSDSRSNSCWSPEPETSCWRSLKAQSLLDSESASWPAPDPLWMKDSGSKCWVSSEVISVWAQLLSGGVIWKLTSSKDIRSCLTSPSWFQIQGSRLLLCFWVWVESSATLMTHLFKLYIPNSYILSTDELRSERLQEWKAKTPVNPSCKISSMCHVRRSNACGSNYDSVIGLCPGKGEGALLSVTILRVDWRCRSWDKLWEDEPLSS